MLDDFEELRKTLAHSQELFERISPGVTDNGIVEPVFGQETPMDAIVHVLGYGTMSRAELIGEIALRIVSLKGKGNREKYQVLYSNGVLKAMLDTELRHQRLEL